MTIELEKDDLANEDVNRANLHTIEDSLNGSSILGFQGKLFEIVGRLEHDHAKFKHPFTFKPTDVIITMSDTEEFITFHPDEFDEEFIVFSTTGPLTVRCLIGKFEQNPVRVDL